MNGIPFQLVLKTPAHLGDDSAIYRANNDQLFIPATRMRGTMRQYLRELLARQGFGSELETEIFGEVTANHAIRAKFSLSDLLSPLNEHLNDVVPAGTKFNGEMFSDVSPKSSADFAIRLSLLAIQNLRR